MSNEAVELSKRMRELAEMIDIALERITGQRHGFTLLVYTDDRASYISNIGRNESIAELKKLLQLWEAGMPDVPAHEVN